MRSAKIISYQTLLFPNLHELQIEVVDRDFNKVYETYRKVTKDGNIFIFRKFGDGALQFIKSKEIEALFLYAEMFDLYQKMQNS